MNYGYFSTKRKKFEFTADEESLILDILNEVCRGFYIDNFEEKISDTKKNALNLWHKINNEFEQGGLIIELNSREIMIIKNSFVEVYKEIEEWEFETRVGMDYSQSKIISDKFFK